MSQKTTPQTKIRPLSTAEQNHIQRLKNRNGINRDIFRPSNSPDKYGNTVEAVHAKELCLEDAEKEFRARVFATTGASSHEVGLKLLISACEAVTKSSDSLEDSVQHLNTIAKTMQPFAPHDEIEGQLLSQLTVLHEHSMIWLGKAIKTERVDFANTYLNGASKLLARHHETLASLLKYRRGGEQRVHVEHVHVHNGGKAIVGNVKGGGGEQKN